MKSYFFFFFTSVWLQVRTRFTDCFVFHVLLHKLFIRAGPIVQRVMSALCELPYGRFCMPRKKELTYEEAADLTNEYWVQRHERAGVAIRDILAGRVVVERFAASSNLEVMIDLIFTFFDKERENWTRWKDKYCRMERNFAKNLYNAIIAVKYNIDWYDKGAKPPVDRITFLKLMNCWLWEPFRNHLNERQRKTARRYLNLIKFYYETFNQDGQEEIAPPDRS